MRRFELVEQPCRRCEATIDRHARAIVRLRQLAALFHESKGHAGPWWTCGSPECLKTIAVIDARALVTA